MTGIDRFWFLTWTTYGHWLPGDRRGCVTRVRDRENPKRHEHDLPGTPYVGEMEGLCESSRKHMLGPPVLLKAAHAEMLLRQFQQTADYRKWLLAGTAIMANHVHVAVGVPGDPDPSDVLGDFKSYGSRALNRQWEKPTSGTWWTQSGSKRKLKNESSVFGAIAYLRTQEFPLVLWINPICDQWTK